MDEISTKAISIGVAIFITIIIVSGIFYVINQMKVIYEQVYETDISIQSMFSEFDAYDNAEKTGIDVFNAIKKYENATNVVVNINDSGVNYTYSGVQGVTIKEWNEYTTYKNLAKSNDKVDIDNLNKHLSTIGAYKYTSSVSLDESTSITTITFKK